MSLRGRFQLVKGGFRLDAAFELPAAGVSALFGPSGAGKSLLLRCIAGLEPEARGELELGGKCWQPGLGACRSGAEEWVGCHRIRACFRTSA